MKASTALPGLLLAVALAGCGSQTSAGAASPPASPVAAPTPEPIPEVEPTCIADYFQVADVADLVDQADAIVRGRATASRDYDAYPDPPSGSDPAVNPQYGVPQEEIDKIPPTRVTALSMEVTEVIKGTLDIGQVIEVHQNACTSRPLPVGQDTDYLLALSSYRPDVPYNQINDSQAAWQVTGDQTLTPVNPRNDLNVTTIDDLDAEVIAQAPLG